MLIPIGEITVNVRRRDTTTKDVQALADSISAVGLLNPITVDCKNHLIAGFHRLETARLLDWTEIECTVCDLEGLQLELAEIDEDFIRKDLSDGEFRELLLRRKEIYENLHPETKNGGDRKSEKIRSAKCTSDSAKSFVDDTAEKLGVDPSTVRRQIQTAKNLTPETKEVIKDANITKTDALKLSRLSPEHQVAAANQLVAGDIQSIDEYQQSQAEPSPEPVPPAPIVPYSIKSRHFATSEESIADLKNPNKDCSYTPDSLLAELDSFIRKFQKEFAWYSDPFCTVVFPDISPIQYEYLKQRLGIISATLHDFLKQIKRSMKNEIQQKDKLTQTGTPVISPGF